MSEICRDAKRRLRSEASQHAEQFDATILHNTLYDQYAEDNDLRELVDLAERAYDAAAGDELDLNVFGAAEDLNKAAAELGEQRVEELITELDDETLDEWRDAWDDEDIEAARRERDEFLSVDEVEA